jgi:hypothetical protein
MNRQFFILLLLATGACFVVVSQGRALHLLIFASFLVAFATATFIDATYKDIQGNTAEVDIKSDKILGVLDGIGIKGRFTTSIAVLFSSFLFLSTFSIIVFRLVPHNITDLMTLAGLKPDKEMALDQDYKKGPLNEVKVKYGETSVGRLTDFEILTELESLAKAGIDRNEISSITDKIRQACTLNDGLCRVAGLYRVSVSFSDNEELDNHPRIKANICPEIEGEENILRKRLRKGYKLRVHSNNSILNASSDTSGNLMKTSTPYLANEEVGSYDPYPMQHDGKYPKEALQACQGNIPWIQLPSSYRTKYDLEPPVGQFTTAYLTTENGIIDNAN